MRSINCHGTLVMIDDRGVLITGPSGSGKSTLALKLLVSAKVMGVVAHLVSDDQVLLSAESGRLMGSVPEAIAGLIEVWAVGPTPIAHVDASPIDLLVKLVQQDKAPRLNNDVNELCEGIFVPVLELAARNAEGGVLAIMAKLSLGLFATN